jgi:hypothetical protein
MELKILLYGLQRSGTNYLETAVNQKYHVLFVNEINDRSGPGHKHFRLYDQKAIIPEPHYGNELTFAGYDDFENHLEIPPDIILVISKDPYSWLLSYKSWAEKCHWPQPGHHYLKEYNLFYGKWLEFARQTDKIQFVRYCDLLNNNDQTLNHLQAKFPLQKKFQWPFRSRLPTLVPQSSYFSKHRRHYYLSEQYLNSYTREELQKINAIIDPQVLSGLGYEKKENVPLQP